MNRLYLLRTFTAIVAALNSFHAAWADKCRLILLKQVTAANELYFRATVAVKKIVPDAREEAQRMIDQAKVDAKLAQELADKTYRDEQTRLNVSLRVLGTLTGRLSAKAKGE